MAKQVFVRVEEKYIMSKNKYQELMILLKNYIQLDEYGSTRICNVYYDTPNFDLISKSIEKPVYKEKVRVRSYEIPTLEDNVFIEIKKKYKGVVNKRRISIKLKDLYKYLESDVKQSGNTQIAKEIAYCFKRYNLIPAVYISYERSSYYGIEDNNLRITFDNNIKSRQYDLKLEKGDYGEILDNDIYIMEVKTLGSIPLWLVKILSNFKIYPSSFSKYGNVYKNKIVKRVS